MLENIIDSREKILWEGKPNRFYYVMGTPFLYLFAIFWAGIDWFYVSAIMSTTGQSDLGPFFGMIIFLHLLPVWIAILFPFLRNRAWKKIEYVLTDRGFYILTGTPGRKIISLEYINISSLEVVVTPVQETFKVGSIQITPYENFFRTQNDEINRFYVMKSLNDPYEVYNIIKKNMPDISERRAHQEDFPIKEMMDTILNSIKK